MKQDKTHWKDLREKKKEVIQMSKVRAFYKERTASASVPRRDRAGLFAKKLEDRGVVQDEVKK